MPQYEVFLENVACAEAPHFALDQQPQLALSIKAAGVKQQTEGAPMAMNVTLEECFRKCTDASSSPTSSSSPWFFSYAQYEGGTCCQCPGKKCTALGDVVNR